MAEVKTGYSLTHAYRYYRDKFKPKGDRYKVTRQQYRDICKEFNQMIVQEVLTGKGVKLPHSMGMLWIKKFKINWDNPPVDLNASKKAGKKIYHLNDHSDGWCAGWKWAKRNQAITNLIYYSFSPTWTNSREVARIMKEEGGHKKFFTYQTY
jgi:hypothetical protein